MSDEIVWKPPFSPPEAAKFPFGGVDHPGMMIWKNAFNGFVVVATHYTADPEKRSKKWYNDFTRNLRYDQIQREMEIDFTSRAGERAFPFLEQNRDKYLVPDIPLDQIPKHWRIIAGLDYGSREPTAIGIYGIDEYRRFTAIMEFYKPSHYKEIAKFLKGTHEDYPHPLWSRIEKVVADPSIFRNDQENPMAEELQSRADLLRNSGIWNLVRGTNERLAGLERVRDMLAYYPNSKKVEPKLFFMQRCEKGWWELTNLLYAEVPPHLLIDKNQSEDIKQKNDHWYDQCFCSGTMIATKNGDIPIENITPGDLALTREGYRPVIASGKTGIKAIFKLMFSNGVELECTGNHPIFTINRGFVRADELNSGDCFLSEESWLTKKKLFIKELPSADILKQKAILIASTTLVTLNTLALVFATFTARYGKAIMEKFQKAIKYTISTEIRLITPSLTLNAYQAQNTEWFTRETFRSGNWKSGPTPRRLKEIAFFAEPNTKDSFPSESIVGQGAGCLIKKTTSASRILQLLRNVPIAVRRLLGEDTGRPFAAVKPAVRLLEKRTCGNAEVYNLSVADCPEYFANGILVHNCRYALMSVEAPSEKPIIDMHDTQTLDLIERQLDQDERARDNEDY